MTNILWLRRDLRLHDHAALHAALRELGNLQPIFIFDSDILKRFQNPRDRRLSFIAAALRGIQEKLRARGGELLVFYGKPEEIIPKLGAEKIFASEDYEPSARLRDAAVEKLAPLHLVKDHVIHAPHEIVKDDGSPYKVFTPYSRAWLAKRTPLFAAPYEIHDQDRYADASTMKARAKSAGLRLLSLESMLNVIGYEEVMGW